MDDLFPIEESGLPLIVILRKRFAEAKECFDKESELEDESGEAIRAETRDELHEATELLAAEERRLLREQHGN